ncbi:MAG: hypothetical protein ACYTBZ_22705, partial [Planctomycetota bacterium]
MNTKKNVKRNLINDSALWTYLKTLLVIALLIQATGCVPGEVKDEDIITSYQKTIVKNSPQPRDSNEGLGSLRPEPE